MAPVDRTSVIIPVYNGERYLAEAIESVLGQTHPPWEVILVDDGSTDGSARIGRSFAPRVRCYYQTQGGVGAALNTGLKLARGDWFAFLDADDLWAEEKLARQSAVLGDDPELDMVFGHVLQFRSPDLFEADPVAGEKILPGHVAGAMLIRRTSFFRVGPLRTDIRVGQFIDWYARAIETGLTSHMMAEVVLKRRIHDSNLGIRERRSQTDYVRVVKAALDRRRGGRTVEGRSASANDPIWKPR